MTPFFRILNRLSTATIIALSVLFDLATSVVFSLFATPNNKIDGLEISVLEKLFIIAIVAPAVETYFFQFLIIKYLKKYANSLVALVVSALAFSAAHTYSLAYIAKTLIAGLEYGILFIYFSEKFNYRYAYLAVVTSHCIYNLLGFTLSHYQII